MKKQNEYWTFNSCDVKITKPYNEKWHFVKREFIISKEKIMFSVSYTCNLQFLAISPPPVLFYIYDDWFVYTHTYVFDDLSCSVGVKYLPTQNRPKCTKGQDIYMKVTKTGNNCSLVKLHTDYMYKGQIPKPFFSWEHCMKWWWTAMLNGCRLRCDQSQLGHFNKGGMMFKRLEPPLPPMNWWCIQLHLSNVFCKIYKYIYANMMIYLS